MDGSGAGVRSVYVDAAAAAVACGVKAATLRVWAHRGHVGTHGRDASGRVLYDLDEVMRHARRVVVDKRQRM